MNVKLSKRTEIKVLRQKHTDGVIEQSNLFFLVLSVCVLLVLSGIYMKFRLPQISIQASTPIGNISRLESGRERVETVAGEIRLVDQQGVVLGTGDENDACRLSPIGCGGEYDVSGGWHSLCSTAEFKINYSPPYSGNTSKSISTFSVNKITHDNQITAGVGEPGETGVYTIWWNDNGNTDPTDDELVINYPSRQNSVDWKIGSLFSPSETEKYNLLINPPTSDMAANETTADTGPFAVNAHVGASGTTNILKDETFQVVIQGWLPGAINPDKANKLGDLAWESVASPNIDFQGRDNPTNGCQDKLTGSYSVVGVPADNYIACVDKQKTFIAESEAQFSSSHWQACRAGRASCSKDYTATLDLTSATGSNYSCSKGHCLDAWNDKSIASLFAPGALAEIGWEAYDIDVDPEKSPGDVYIKDLYSATGCELSKDGQEIGIACIHPGPGYVQAHVMLYQLSMAPTDVDEILDTEGNVLRAGMMDTFWHAVGEYWQNMGVLCRE